MWCSGVLMHQAYETQLAQTDKSSPCANLGDAAFRYFQQTWETTGSAMTVI